MVKSTKTTKGKISSEKKKDSFKTKSAKGKENPNELKEQIKSALLEDDQWQSMLVMFIIQNQRLHDVFLSQLNNLSKIFTVVTPEVLYKIDGEDSSEKKSRANSKKSKASIRSVSKSSKKTSKTKDAKTTKADKKGNKKGDKKEKVSNDITQEKAIKICFLLKKLMLDLREKDIKETEEAESGTELQKSNGIEERKNVGTYDEQIRKHESMLVENSLSESAVKQRYFILLGFYDMELFKELPNFNIFIKAVIHVKEKSDGAKPKSTEDRLEKVTPKAADKKLKAKSIKESSASKINEECLIFIDEFTKNKSDKKFLEENQDVIFLNYTVIEDGVNVLDVNSSFEADILKLLYGISEAWEKFRKYTKVIKIQEIPDSENIIPLYEAILYNTMISMIPLECTTIPLVLHCILEQVCWWNGEVINEEKQENKKTEDSNDSETIHSDNIDSDSTVSEFVIKDITPILIDIRNEIKFKTFHLNLPEINFQQITKNMFSASPVFRLWQQYPPHSIPELKFYDFHVQKFKKSAENWYFDTHTLFIKYLHQSVMNILTLKQDKLSLSRNVLILPEDEEDTSLLFSSRDQEDLEKFVQGLINSILCEVTRISLFNPEYKRIDVNPGYSFEKSNTKESSVLYIQPNWFEVKALPSLTNSQNGSLGLLDDKLKYKLRKLSKLKSFLLCSDFVNLYKDDILLDSNGIITDNMKNYKFIQNLDTVTMCHSLQKSYENFLDVNYYYFAPSDVILLWFNNKTDKNVTLSRKVCGVLETPLGFRDFYKYKLEAKTNLIFVPKPEEPTPPGSYDESHFSNQNIHQRQENHIKINEFLPFIACNLGHFRVQATDSYNYFFSPDSSSVIVKHTTNFDKKQTISVNISKNNTSISYDLSDRISDEGINIKMMFSEGIMINTNLSRDSPQTLPFNGVDDSAKTAAIELADSNPRINVNLNITLPSGLFIEIVPLNSDIGPFYVRQRYLIKGPSCSNIWGEAYRCYLKNGTVIIFYSNDTVEILYSNGTKVKCDSFKLEKIKFENLNNNSVKENDLKDIKNNGGPTEYGDIKGKDKGRKKSKERKGSRKEKSEEGNDSSRKKSNERKGNKGKKAKNKKDSEMPTVVEELENEQNNVEKYILKILEHSVLSWDGSLIEFNNGICKKMEPSHALRMAFDSINQEMFLQRSDGLASYFSNNNLIVTYPDGTKITSHTNDSKELSHHNNVIEERDETSTRVPSTLIDLGLPLVSKIIETESVKEFMAASSIAEDEVEHEEFYDEDNFILVETTYLLEHKNYATVKFINEGTDDYRLQIILPGNISISIDKSGYFIIDSDDREKIILTDETMVYEAHVTNNSLQHSSTTLFFNNDTIKSETHDSLDNTFLVNEKGQTNLIPSCFEGDRQNPLPLFPENIQRFFVFNRDLTGYEMIHHFQKAYTFHEYQKNKNKTERQIIKSPVLKDRDDILSVYIQNPIYSTFSDRYTTEYCNVKSLPTLIKRRDLLKQQEMPKIIWFHPYISKVTHCESESIIKQDPKQNPKAITILKYSRIKKDINLQAWFSMAIDKYMETSEDLFKKYLQYYPGEIRRENIFADGEQHRRDVFESKSYYLIDNIPVINLEKSLNTESQISINTILTSTASKST